MRKETKINLAVDENQFYSHEAGRGRVHQFFAADRTWLNILLFVLTGISCFVVGITWSLNYKYAGVLGQKGDFSLTSRIIRDPQVLYLSGIYTVVLMGILLGHELGHFLMSRHYRIDATLPFFIPAPTLIGTMGAFIKIRSPISRKKQLFDIGIAGPLISFILAVPALAIGLYYSKAVPPLAQEGSILFGEPLLLKWIVSMVFRSVPGNFVIVLHPVAFAGWVGILVTALNLFPIGQLDGGHVFYALLGKKSAKFGKIFIGLFIIMGVFFWMGWFVWALLISFLGLKHPSLIDENMPLSRGRRIIAVAGVVIFVLSFIPDPVKGYSLLDIFNGVPLF